MSARLTYLTTILPQLAHRLILLASGPGVTHHTKPDGPLVLQPCHLDRKNRALRDLVERDVDRLAVGLGLIIDAARELEGDSNLPAFVARWPQLVGSCKSACSSELPTTDLLTALGGEEPSRGRSNGLPAFPPEEATARAEARHQIMLALGPAVGHLLRAMGRRHGDEAMVRRADQFDGGVGSPSQRAMEEEVGSADAPDLVFRRSPVVGKARVEATRALMDPMAPHNRLVTYMKHDFADDVVWVLNGAPTVPSCEQVWSNGAVTLSPARLGPQNRRIAAWTDERRDPFAVALFWAVLLDQGVYTWRRNTHPDWVASMAVPFPKLVGDCPGGCGYHLPPYHAIEAVGARAGSEYGRRVVERRTNLLRHSLAEMKPYTLSLFERASIVAPEELWGRCEGYLPAWPMETGNATERTART